MKELKNYFYDDEGKLSSTRINCLVALVVAIIATFATKDFQLAAVWVTAAFGSKAAQKFAEVRRNIR